GAIVNAVIPFPLRAITCGESGELSLMVTAPVMAPAVVGVKVTLILQLAPAFSVDGQFVTSAKLPLAVIEAMETAVVPLFFTVTALAALVVPMTCAGKLTDEGVGVTMG